MDLFQAVRRSFILRKRRKTLPTLYIPITRGPLSNFYHFLVGYWLPLFWYRHKNSTGSIAVMSCPPFDNWFSYLPGKEVKVLPQSKVAKHAFLARGTGFTREYRIESIFGWDKWERFDTRPLREIAGAIRDEFSHTTKKESSIKAEIIIFSREYLHQGGGNNSARPSGAEKRNIPNLSEIVSGLSNTYAVELIEPEKLSPADLAGKCQRAKVVIGQHGAALANMVFMAPNTRVIEIVWPEFLPDAHSVLYGLLARNLDLDYSQVVLQKDPYDRVDPQKVRALVDKSMA